MVSGANEAHRFRSAAMIFLQQTTEQSTGSVL